MVDSGAVVGSIGSAVMGVSSGGNDSIASGVPSVGRASTGAGLSSVAAGAVGTAVSCTGGSVTTSVAAGGSVGVPPSASTDCTLTMLTHSITINNKVRIA